MAAKRVPVSGIVLGFVLLGYLAAFLFAVYEGTPARIIPRYLMTWRSLRAAVTLSALIVPMLFAAAAAAASFAVPAGGKSFDAIKPLLPPALVLCVLASAFRLVALPPLVTTLRTAETASRHFKEALKAADDAMRRKDYDDARRFLAVCRGIDAYDSSYSKLNDAVEAEILKRAKTDEAEPAAPAPDPKPTVAPEQNAEGWYARARDAEAKGDYLTALFFIDRALTLSPREPAYREARKRILDGVGRLKPPPEDAENAAVYAKKLEGYQALRSGDPRKAYAVYLELSKKLPNDPDVERYLAESLAELSNSAVFFDTMLRALSTAPAERFFVVRRNGDTERVLAATRAVDSWDSVYFEGFELAVFEGGNPVVRVSAPYARLRGSTVFLRTVDRDAPDTVFEPVWTKGAPDLPFFADAPMGHEEAARILALRHGLDAVSLPTLWSGLDDVRSYGLDPLPYRKELATRIAFPFAAMIAALLGTAFGARFRRKEAPGAVDTVVGIAIMTAVASFLFAGLAYLGRLAVEACYQALPPPLALTAWIVLLGATTLCSLLAAARALSHVRA